MKNFLLKILFLALLLSPSLSFSQLNALSGDTTKYDFVILMYNRDVLASPKLALIDRNSYLSLDDILNLKENQKSNASRARNYRTLLEGLYYMQEQEYELVSSFSQGNDGFITEFVYRKRKKSKF